MIWEVVREMLGRRRERERQMKTHVSRKGEEFMVEVRPLDLGDSRDMDIAAGSCHDDLYTTIIDTSRQLIDMIA